MAGDVFLLLVFYALTYEVLVFATANLADHEADFMLKQPIVVLEVALGEQLAQTPDAFICFQVSHIVDHSIFLKKTQHILVQNPNEWIFLENIFQASFFQNCEEILLTVGSCGLFGPWELCPVKLHHFWLLDFLQSNFRCPFQIQAVRVDVLLIQLSQLREVIVGKCLRCFMSGEGILLLILHFSYQKCFNKLSFGLVELAESIEYFMGQQDWVNAEVISLHQELNRLVPLHALYLKDGLIPPAHGGLLADELVVEIGWGEHIKELICCH